jgi:dTDP-4-amino-4,6-dideoxygalactose transaminase
MPASYPLLGRYVVPDMPAAEDLLPWLQRIDANRWYSNFGPLVGEFERRLTAHLAALDKIPDAKPLALTTLISCYHALQIGLQVLHLPKDARVLVPAVTFPACPLAVRHAGAEPVLADIDPDTWQLTPAIAYCAVANMPVHAVMPVAVYGVPVSTEEWDRFTEDTGIPVIIDAAAALETQAIPRKGLVAHSLHATKPFSVGEGGLLIARDPALIEEARCIANFGTRDRIAVMDGGNAKMSEYHGAVALAQLARWEDVKQRRCAIFSRIRTAIEEAGLNVGFQSDIEHAIAGSLMLKTDARPAEEIISGLSGRGIFAHRMYLPPLYRHPHFANLAAAKCDGRVLPATAPFALKEALMENSEMMMRCVFGLPFHAFLEACDIECMVDALAEILQKPKSGRDSRTATA